MGFLKVTFIFGMYGAVSLLALATLGGLGSWTLPAAVAVAYLATIWTYATAGPRAPTGSAPSSTGAGGFGATGLGAGALAGMAMGAAAHEYASHDDFATAMPSPVFNPATGLPMVGDSYAGVDVGGNTFGSSDAFGSSDTFASHDFSSDPFSSDAFGSDAFSSSSDPW